MARTYRILPYEEWDRLVPIMERNKAPLPSQSIAKAAVCEDEDGTIIGVLFLQTVCHLEPLVLDHPTVNFLRLQKTIEESLPLDVQGLSVYAYTRTDRMKQLVEFAGFERIGEFWEKKIDGIPKPE